MPIRRQTKDGRIVNFPDSMKPHEIDAAMAKFESGEGPKPPPWSGESPIEKSFREFQEKPLVPATKAVELFLGPGERADPNVQGVARSIENMSHPSTVAAGLGIAALTTLGFPGFALGMGLSGLGVYEAYKKYMKAFSEPDEYERQAKKAEAVTEGGLNALPFLAPAGYKGYQGVKGALARPAPPPAAPVPPPALPPQPTAPVAPPVAPRPVPTGQRPLAPVPQQPVAPPPAPAPIPNVPPVMQPPIRPVPPPVAPPPVTPPPGAGPLWNVPTERLPPPTAPVPRRPTPVPPAPEIPIDQMTEAQLLELALRNARQGKVNVATPAEVQKSGAEPITIPREMLPPELRDQPPPATPDPSRIVPPEPQIAPETTVGGLAYEDIPPGGYLPPGMARRTEVERITGRKGPTPAPVRPPTPTPRPAPEYIGPERQLGPADLPEPIRSVIEPPALPGAKTFEGPLPAEPRGVPVIPKKKGREKSAEYTRWEARMRKAGFDPEAVRKMTPEERRARNIRLPPQPDPSKGLINAIQAAGRIRSPKPEDLSNWEDLTRAEWMQIFSSKKGAKGSDEMPGALEEFGYQFESEDALRQAIFAELRRRREGKRGAPDEESLFAQEQIIRERDELRRRVEELEGRKTGDEDIPFDPEEFGPEPPKGGGEAGFADITPLWRGRNQRKRKILKQIVDLENRYDKLNPIEQRHLDALHEQAEKLDPKWYHSEEGPATEKSLLRKWMVAKKDEAANIARRRELGLEPKPFGEETPDQGVARLTQRLKDEYGTDELYEPPADTFLDEAERVPRRVDEVDTEAGLRAFGLEPTPEQRRAGFRGIEGGLSKREKQILEGGDPFEPDPEAGFADITPIWRRGKNKEVDPKVYDYYQRMMGALKHFGEKARNRTITPEEEAYVREHIKLWDRVQKGESLPEAEFHELTRNRPLGNPPPFSKIRERLEGPEGKPPTGIPERQYWETQGMHERDKKVGTLLNKARKLAEKEDWDKWHDIQDEINNLMNLTPGELHDLGRGLHELTTGADLEGKPHKSLADIEKENKYWEQKGLEERDKFLSKLDKETYEAVKREDWRSVDEINQQIDVLRSLTREELRELAGQPKPKPPSPMGELDRESRWRELHEKLRKGKWLTEEELGEIRNLNEEFGEGLPTDDPEAGFADISWPGKKKRQPQRGLFEETPTEMLLGAEAVRGVEAAKEKTPGKLVKLLTEKPTEKPTNPLLDLAKEIDEFGAKQRETSKQEFYNKVLNAPPTSKSKRELLGWTKPRKKGEAPMFEEPERGLFEKTIEPAKIRRDKRFIGRRVEVTNPGSKLLGRTGTIKGFRGDQEEGNPYVTVLIDGHHVETISARGLTLIPEEKKP